MRTVQTLWRAVGRAVGNAKLADYFAASSPYAFPRVQRRCAAYRASLMRWRRGMILEN